MKAYKSFHQETGDVTVRRVQRWTQLSLLALDPSEEIRQRFANKTHKYCLSRGLLWFEYGVFLLLVACQDSKESVHYARFVKLVKKLKGKSVEMQALSKAKKGADLSAARDVYIKYSPENMLPNLVYLLAHHPSLTLNSPSYLASHQDIYTKPLSALLHCLEDEVGAQAGFLFAYLNVMREKQDALDTQSSCIHVVGELARKIIEKDYTYNAQSLGEYPGTVPLPVCYQAPLKPVSSDGLTSPFNSFLPANFELKPVRHLKSTPKTASRRKSLSKPASSKKKKRKNTRKLDLDLVSEEEGDYDEEESPARINPRRLSAGKVKYTEESEESDEE